MYARNVRGWLSVTAWVVMTVACSPTTEPETTDGGLRLDAQSTPDASRDDAGADATENEDASLDAASVQDPDAPLQDALDPCTRCSIDATCSMGMCACNVGFVGDGRTCVPAGAGFSAVEAYIKASNTGSYDWLGRSSIALSADGNTLAIGAYSEDGAGMGVSPPSSEGEPSSGAVYVYRRTGVVWAFEAYIKASNAEINDRFGISVALSGDGNTLVVGADREGGSGTGVNPPSNETALGSGAAYVYRRTGAVWAFEAYIKASNTGGYDNFGLTVALSTDGSTLAVAADHEDGSLTGANPPSNEDAMDSGAVYVYRRTGAMWAFEAYIKASNTGSLDYFGRSIALSADGNTLGVGANWEDGSGMGINPPSDEGVVHSGAAYLYRRVGTAWAFDAYIKASNTQSDDWFGASIALSGDGNTLAVGAYQEDGSGTGINPLSDEGARESGTVYVYRRTAAMWAFEAYIKASNTGTFDNFGLSVALSANGNTLAVGAYQEDGSLTGVNPTSNDSGIDNGAAYVYRRAGAMWAFDAYIKASNAGRNDYFGEWLALSADGRTLAVGAFLEDGSGTGINPPSDEGATDSGAVYIYR